MVISYYHGDFVVHIENSMIMTGFMLFECLVGGCVYLITANLKYLCL